jgi:hypothetical protein
VPATIHQTCFAQNGFIDKASVIQSIKVNEVDRGVANLKGCVIEAALGDPSDEGHLTSLKSQAE